MKKIQLIKQKSKKTWNRTMAALFLMLIMLLSVFSSCEKPDNDNDDNGIQPEYGVRSTHFIK
jgi:hypothetical protein